MGSPRKSDLTLPVALLAPQDITGGAATGSYIDVSAVENFAVVVHFGAIASAATAMDVTINEATDTSGTSAQALTYTEAYWASSTGKTAATVSSGAVEVTASDDNKILVIPLRQQQLSANDDMLAVTVAISSPGANSVLVSAQIVLSDQRFNKVV